MSENQCLDYYVEPHQRVYCGRKQTANCAALSIYVISTVTALYIWPGVETCSRDRTNSRPMRTKPGAPQSWMRLEGKSPGCGRKCKRQVENVCRSRNEACLGSTSCRGPESRPMSLHRTNPPCCSSFGIYGAKCMPREGCQSKIKLYGLPRLTSLESQLVLYVFDYR
jgi:hypothetical protein